MGIIAEGYLDHLRSESARFAVAAAAADVDAQVPSCPGWTTADLLWHLAEVQWFWGTIVRRRIVDTEQAEALQLERPAEASDLWALFHDASAGLVDALATADPADPAWTWWDDDRTVAFILRRQAHEALIHRVDAELAGGGAHGPLDPMLAADGVDEALRIMYGETAADDPGAAGSVRVVSADTGHTWRLALAGANGDTFLQVRPTDDGAPVAADVTASAADLDCWLWNRPIHGEVRRSGDAATLAAVDAVLARGAQ